MTWQEQANIDLIERLQRELQQLRNVEQVQVAIIHTLSEELTEAKRQLFRYKNLLTSMGKQ